MENPILDASAVRDTYTKPMMNLTNQIEKTIDAMEQADNAVTKARNTKKKYDEVFNRLKRNINGGC